MRATAGSAGRCLAEAEGEGGPATTTAVTTPIVTMSCFTRLLQRLERSMRATSGARRPRVLRAGNVNVIIPRRRVM
jgi:hypothetical protein